jgi:DNA-binding LytR/AlgR family response regulator
MTIRCITVDDEPLALSKMQGFIEKVPFLSLEASFTNGLDTLEYIKNHEIDLLFLDIQMNDITGIQLMQSLEDSPIVIFTTAYDDYAIKGFDLSICDYLLKPISFERFLKAVNRAYDILRTQDASAKEKQTSTLQSKNTISNNGKKAFMFLKTEYRMQKVVFEDILYIQGMKDYLLVKTPGSNIMTIMTFKKMLELLPDYFIRVHKSYIIPISKIESIERHGIKIGEKIIPLGDHYKDDFRILLKEIGVTI